MENHMNYIENESTFRYLRKQHKDWSLEKINSEAIKIWKNYMIVNKEKLGEEVINRRTQGGKCLDREALFFDLND